MPQYELNLRDYWRIFRKRKLTIIAVFLAVTLFNFITTFLYTPKETTTYKTSATVKIEERKTIAGLLTEEIMYNPADRMSSETMLIKGSSIMKRAAEKLVMIGPDSTKDEINEAIGELQASIETEKITDTNMIKIIATSDTAQKAMDIANAVALAYIEDNLLEKAKQARTARQFIEEQLSSLETRSREVEERINQYALEMKDFKLAEPIQQQLINLEAQLADLLQKYTDKHPEVLQVKERIAELEARLMLYSGREFGQRGLEYARLERESEVNKKLYAMLKERLEETRIIEAQKVSDISIVDPATLPVGSKRASKITRYLFGVMLGLILGLTSAFVRESMDTSIGTIEDVENIIKLPVLGVIPSIPTITKKETNFFLRMKQIFYPTEKSPEEEDYISLIVHHQPTSPVSEAYRNIRTNLQLDSSKKTILITSTGPREGKTTIVSNLGMALAQKGTKVLLVGFDLRRPHLHKIFGLEREPGINEVISGKVKLSEALRNISDIMLGKMRLEEILKSPGMENIWILPSGHIPPNPSEIIGSKETSNLINELKNQFEVILFDSPPVLPVTDPSLLSAKVDGVILCYEVGRTSRDALSRTKIQLESVGAKILGVVLNHIAPQTEEMGVYPYYYKYKYRYTEKEQEDKPKPK